MKQAISVAILVLTVSLTAVAQLAQPTNGDGNLEQTIRQLENENRQATLNNDAKVFERLLADDWINTNANGTVTTKAQLLNLLKSEAFKFAAIEYDDVLIRTYKDTAIVTGRSTTKRTGQDNNILTRQVRFTRVYVRRDKGWQVVSAQSTPITQQ